MAESHEKVPHTGHVDSAKRKDVKNASTRMSSSPNIWRLYPMGTDASNGEFNATMEARLVGNDVRISLSTSIIVVVEFAVVFILIVLDWIGGKEPTVVVLW